MREDEVAGSRRRSIFRAAWLSIPFALIVVGKVVAGFQDSSNAGVQRVQIVLTVCLVAVAIVAAFAVWVPLQAWIRVRRVVVRVPGATVVAGQWSRTYAEGLVTLGLGPVPKYSNTYALSFDEDGLRFWFGLFRPNPKILLPWSSIHHAEPGMDTDANRRVSTVNVIVAGLGGEVAIGLAICRTIANLGHERLDELESLAAEVRSHIGPTPTNRAKHPN